MSDTEPIYPSQISTRDRSEMVCPACFTKGLEENPAFKGDYSGTADLLKATRCPDPSCSNHGGIEPEEIREQVDTQPIGDVLSVITDLNISLSAVAQAAAVLIGFLFILNQVFGLGFLGDVGLGGPSEVALDGHTVVGEIVTPNGSGLTATDGLLLELSPGDEFARTDETGTFVFENIASGDYTLTAEPPDTAEIAPIPITVASDGTVTSEKTGVITDNQVTVTPTDASITTFEAISGPSTLDVSYDNPLNVRSNPQVRIEPVVTRETTQTRPVSTASSTEFSIPGTPVDSTISLDAQISRQDVFDESTWSGTTGRFAALGNLPPREFKISVEEESGYPTKQEFYRVSDGDTREFTVEGGRTRGEAEIAIFGGTAEGERVKEGVWSGVDPRVTIEEESAPSTLTITLDGQLEDESRQQTGSVSGGVITPFIEGTLPAVGAQITFEGGVPETTRIGSDTLDMAGTEGPRTREVLIATVSDTGTYEIQPDVTVRQHPEYVDTEYRIGLDTYPIVEGMEPQTHELQAGDRIYLRQSVTRNANVEPEPYSDSSAVQIRDVSFTSTSASPGEFIELEVELFNPRSVAERKQIVLFEDNNDLRTRSVTVEPGERKTTSETWIAPSEAGAYVISVSDSKPYVIEVGDVNTEIGSARADLMVDRVGDSGTITMDTTQDGTFDCTVSADGGTCVLDTIPSGTNSFNIQQQGVTNTAYRIEYISRDGPENVEVDVGYNGEIDMRHQGIFRDGDTIRDTFELGAGETRIGIQTSNDVPVQYELVTTRAAVVSNPTVTLNGVDVVSDVGQFQGRETFSLGQLPAGNNVVEFGSSSGEYLAELTWTEQGADRFPRATLNTETVCEPSIFAQNQECSINPRAVNPGTTNSIGFSGGSETFDYSISYVAQATAQSVDVTVNNELVEFRRELATNVREDGSWTRESALQTLRPGDNTISVSAPRVMGIPVEVTGDIQYSFEPTPAERPTVTLQTPSGITHQYEVPEEALSSANTLEEAFTLEIPKEHLEKGEHTLQVDSENEGTLKMTFQSLGVSNDDVEFTDIAR